MNVCTVIGLIIQTNIICSHNTLQNFAEAVSFKFLLGLTIFLIENACLCKVFEGKQRVLFISLLLEKGLLCESRSI